MFDEVVDDIGRGTLANDLLVGFAKEMIDSEVAEFGLVGTLNVPRDYHVEGPQVSIECYRQLVGVEERDGAIVEMG